MAKKATKTEDRRVTDAELQEIQKQVGFMNQLQMQIGGLELQKAELATQMNAAREVMQELQNALMDTYGDVTVNLTDGTITDNADNS